MPEIPILYYPFKILSSLNRSTMYKLLRGMQVTPNDKHRNWVKNMVQHFQKESQEFRARMQAIKSSKQILYALRRQKLAEENRKYRNDMLERAAALQKEKEEAEMLETTEKVEKEMRRQKAVRIFV